MDITRRFSLIFLAFLLAITGYSQTIKVSNLYSAGFVNSGSGTASNGFNTLGGIDNAGGTTNRGPTTTQQRSALNISGAFALSPTLQVGLAIDQSTNAYKYFVTNANLTFTLTGTALDGARGQLDIKNTGATNIAVGWPLSWSISQGALVTSFTAYSNSITEVFWYNEGGSNRVRVAAKEIVENFTAPTAGQVVGFHDANTKTNLTVSGTGDVTAAANFGTDNVALRADGTGKGAQGSGITIDDSNNLGTPGGLRGQTANVTNTLAVGGLASLTTSSNSGTALVAGAVGLGSTISGSGAASFGTISTPNVLISSNSTYTTANLVPSGNSTNFTADYDFGARTYDMTNALWVSAIANAPAANLWKGWSAILRNNSGGALRVGVAAAFKRSGTNNVSVGNAQRAKIIIEPDGTGGTDLTNHLAQIILFDSP